MPSVPTVDKKYCEGYLRVASVFGFQAPKGKSSWESLSAVEARAEYNRLISIFEELSHGERCGCSKVVMTLFAAAHLPRFIDLYLKFVKDDNTLIPFALILFRLVPEPYLVSFVRQYSDPQLLLRHQIQTFLSNRLDRLESTTFTSISQLEEWGFEVSNVYKLALFLRTLLYHLSKSHDVPNPIVLSQATSDLVKAIDRLLPSLTYRLEVPFDRTTIIGSRPSRVAYKQFTQESMELESQIKDAVHHLRPVLALLRREKDADARLPFKLINSMSEVMLFPEDVCALAAEKDKTVVCESGELKACSKCRAIVYCSRDHQSLHWKKHKDSCFEPGW